MDSITNKKEATTFTEFMRIRFHSVLELVAGLLNRIGIMPNTLTIMGVVGNIIGAYYLSQGMMTVGGIIIFIMGFVDALDGTMARLRGMAGEFGSFVDSVSDRYSELIIFGGLLYFYTKTGDTLPVILVYLAAAGSVLVSYIRSRGQSLGWDTKVGLLTRMERYMVLAPSLVFNKPEIGLWIIAVFANITAIQRMIDVRRQAIAQRNEKMGVNLHRK